MGDTLPTTVGFEAEFQSGAPDVMSYLYRSGEGLVGSNRLHRYHCDDSVCRDYPLHGQTDSSCSGEIISDVIYDWDTVVNLTEALEVAAVEVDAVPGVDAGFHVHIGRPDRESAHRRNAFFEALRFEPVLQSLARGRFIVQRTNNATVTDSLYRVLSSLNGPWYTGVRDEWCDSINYQPHNAIEWVRHQPNQATIKENLYISHRDNDRHNNLGVRTRYSTWEFRFWNSTRSAWRMQMYVGLSAAFANQRFVTKLMNTDALPGRRPRESVQHIIDALAYGQMHTTAELVTRQLTYMDGMDSGHINVPSEFTIV